MLISTADTRGYCNSLRAKIQHVRLSYFFRLFESLSSVAKQHRNSSHHERRLSLFASEDYFSWEDRIKYSNYEFSTCNLFFQVSWFYLIITGLISSYLMQENHIQWFLMVLLSSLLSYRNQPFILLYWTNDWFLCETQGLDGNGLMSFCLHQNQDNCAVISS